MSKVKIEVKSEGYYTGIGRTVVYVDGKFAYQSGNATAVECDHIEKLIELLQVDNTEVIFVYDKE